MNTLDQYLQKFYVIVYEICKVIFFPMKLYKKTYLHGKFILELVIEFLFLLSHMFPWMNNLPITGNMFLPRLVK